MVVGLLLCGGVGDGGESAAGKHFESEVAAAFCPFVGLLGQDSADETDDGGPDREDADRIGAATDLPVESLGGDQIWVQTSLSKPVKARMSSRAPARWSATSGRCSAV